ncbi:MAG: hypothetical protein HOG03_23305 [Desulfobacula sp.]|uniref:MJ1255/VC2487 family glycosyltransferase n=1 Tax=Desulfobacula sp. TaxID=2593537 RepID=UPI001EBD48E9|nr:hypothetical protein [Desulfobacula sp.]MBT4876297.1 hypothetical protein [Desulfobacula sp.]MBT5546469.1 hypothetical protein [Desulfobacula sp.]MBT5972716.1 hypothetical protein [Desulfobacula sp.]MBT7712564.1 hypothetical protein [Deltaproteobacteria bacterium]
MKILYGIQGTGNGHITRSTQIIDALKKYGVTIDVIISGCNTDKVFEKATLGPVRFFKGFTFAIQNGRIHVAHTIKNLSVLRFIKDTQSFDASKYDVVITDFEPVTSMIAKKNKIPCIGIGHQYAFSYKIPMGRRPLFPRLFLKKFASADYSIGMHWHHFDQPIIPPVITNRLKTAKKTKKHVVLVYLPFENSDSIRTFLRPFKNHIFCVYGSANSTSQPFDENITWNPFSKTTFYEDLSHCSGVICNAGFELPSEALSIGKKLLVKPLLGQFEQESNAIALKKLNLGMMMNHLNPKILGNWLEKKSTIKRKYPDVAHQISLWVMEGNWSDVQQLINNTWYLNSKQH